MKLFLFFLPRLPVISVTFEHLARQAV